MACPMKMTGLGLQKKQNKVHTPCHFAYSYITTQINGSRFGWSVRNRLCSSKEETGMTKLKVLLVDDESEFVETLAARLKMRDLEADTAHDGEQALSAVKEKEPDVIVLDLKMPGIDGIEVLKRVKKAYPNVEVIVLTGHGSEKDREIVRRLGAFDYINKPVDLDELVPRIKKAFKQKLKKLEKMSMAITFAQAGEFDTAKKMMEDEKQKNKKGH